MQIKQRFESKFIKTDNCWQWLGHIKKTGYGQFSVNNKPMRAHRVSYELYVGKIPYGMHVLHKCDNRKCVNPKHLFLGTNYDNIKDKVSKGRQVKGEKSSHARLNERQVIEARSFYAAGISIISLAKNYGISERGMRKIINNESWKSIKIESK